MERVLKDDLNIRDRLDAIIDRFYSALISPTDYGNEEIYSRIWYDLSFASDHPALTWYEMAKIRKIMRACKRRMKRKRRCSHMKEVPRIG